MAKQKETPAKEVKVITQTIEQFLNEKGINPPIKEMQIQNLNYYQLVELMVEWKQK